MLVAIFPSGKREGDNVAHGFKGKGVLIRLLTDAKRCPWSQVSQWLRQVSASRLSHYLNL